MDIGSAKITKEEMDGVCHHLIDILEPDEEFHVALFQKLAKEAMEQIRLRGHIPIQALLYDIDFTENEDEGGNIRRELENVAKEKGADYLHERLREIDPKSADAIHANNIKRVVRALEFYYLTGKQISEHNETERAKESPYAFLYYVLNTDREILYKRIEERVDSMLKEGLIDEVRHLKEMGMNRGMVSMQGLGYKEILDYLNGMCSLEEAVSVLKRDTRHFAKRQITWFKREREVTWLNLPDYENDKTRILAKICEDCREKLGVEEIR